MCVSFSSINFLMNFLNRLSGLIILSALHELCLDEMCFLVFFFLVVLFNCLSGVSITAKFPAL